MRKLVMCLAFSLLSGAAVSAQQPAAQGRPEEPKLYTSASDITALIAKARSERKKDEPRIGETILRLAPYNAALEYRASVGPAAVHDHEAEVFYVIDGSATMVTGGKLVGETRTNPENLAGTAIEGGESRTIAKGDFIIVPENTPHWFSAINQTLVLMTLHVPRPVPSAH
jgi:mannose-6-phosphate isomerase-like protein (cupin superfamily)